MTSPSPATEPGARGFAKSIDKLVRLWGFPGNRLADVCAVALILAIGAATAFIGAVHTRIFGHDIFLLLDSGWRVINGQRPEVDFSPGVGPLLGLIMGAGLKLAGNSVNGVGVASALVGTVVGLWGYALCRQRMSWTPALLTGLLLALIAVAPYPLGVPPNTLSHAMVYNRYGYALLGLAVAETFQSPRRDSMAAAFTGGASTGVVSVLALFLKPSYGLVALAFAGWSVLMRWSRWRAAGMVTGLAGSGLAMMAYLRFDFPAVLHDFQMLAAAKGSGLSLWGVRWALIKGLREFLPLAVLAVFVALMRSRRQSIVPSLQPLAAAFLLLVAGGLLLATNGQASGYPLNAVLAILLIEKGRAAAEEPGRGADGLLRAETVVLLLGLACFLPSFTANASGLGYALLESGRNAPEAQAARIQAPQLESLGLYDVPQGTEADRRSNGHVYAMYVNDGMDLIRGVSKPDETVTTLDIFNPFSYALLRRPARGGVANLVFNFTYNDGHKPSPEWLFGSADIVMVPKHPSTAPADAEPLFRNFLPSIKAARRLCAESDWWELYKRPSSLDGCPAHP